MRALLLLPLLVAGWTAYGSKCSYVIADQLYGNIVWVGEEVPMPLHRFRTLLGPDAEILPAMIEWIPRGAQFEVIPSPFDGIRGRFLRVGTPVEDLDNDTFRFKAAWFWMTVSRRISDLERAIAQRGTATVPHLESGVFGVEFSDGSSAHLEPVLGREREGEVDLRMLSELHEPVMAAQRRGARLTKVFHLHNHSQEPLRKIAPEPAGALVSYPSQADAGLLDALTEWVTESRTLSVYEWAQLPPANASALRACSQWDFSGGVAVEVRVVVGVEPDRLVTFTLSALTPLFLH